MNKFLLAISSPSFQNGSAMRTVAGKCNRSSRGDQKSGARQAIGAKRLRCAECGGQLHSVPWMLRARYAVSVAVITSAALGRRRSSRPVGYAVGTVGFLFAPGKVRRDALRISPTCILDPLRSRECWGGRSAYKSNENELCRI